MTNLHYVSTQHIISAVRAAGRLPMAKRSWRAEIISRLERGTSAFHPTSALIEFARCRPRSLIDFRGFPMQPLLRLLVLLFLVLASTLPAQTRTIAERLGYPADAKLLILHADDLGASHSVDVASFDALDKGAVSSASIMMPTPWVTEVAAYARAHPNADLGLHLTLTSEWETYRWGSVSPPDKIPSLLDSDGSFPNDSKVVAA